MSFLKLELITDIVMHQFVERGTRGGTSYIANRHSKDDNKYVKTYNKDLPPKHIINLDANNLYGCAMSQPLPTGGFKWSPSENLPREGIKEYIRKYIGWEKKGVPGDRSRVPRRTTRLT